MTPALRPGSKVLIYEYVLEDGPVTDLTGAFRISDGHDHGDAFNAQERTARDFERMLNAADERFVVEGVHRPEGSTMSVVEVEWRG